MPSSGPPTSCRHRHLRVAPYTRTDRELQPGPFYRKARELY
jgi:hypothetical protein